MNRIYIVLILFISWSCNDKPKEEFYISGSDYGYKSDLKEKIISNGDKNAYEELRIAYLKDDKTTDLLAYALIMANKYDFTRAYYDVFDILYTVGIYSDYSLCPDYSLECLDEETKKIALEYFRKAIEKGDLSASSILLDSYDKDKSYPIEELYVDVELIAKAKFNMGETKEHK